MFLVRLLCRSLLRRTELVATLGFRGLAPLSVVGWVSAVVHSASGTHAPRVIDSGIFRLTDDLVNLLPQDVNLTREKACWGS